MLPSMFERAIREKCGDAAEIRSHETLWSDEPMEHGYVEPGMEGLKEYQGTADEVVAHNSPSAQSLPRLGSLRGAMKACVAANGGVTFIAQTSPARNCRK
jgi:hypothetical protein